MNKQGEIDFNNSLIRALTTHKNYANELVNWSTCNKCGLCNTRSRVVFAGGIPNSSSLTIIGEAPGPDEDKAGIPFVGKTGTFLREVLDRVLIPSESIFWTNAVGCEPKDMVEGHFRAPTTDELIACRPRLKWLFDNVIKNHKCILLLGKSSFVAIKALIDNLDEKAITKLSREFKVAENLGWHKLSPDLPMVYFTFHPSYIERTGREKVITQSWIDDLKIVKKYMATNAMDVAANRKVIDHAKR